MSSFSSSTVFLVFVFGEEAEAEDKMHGTEDHQGHDHTESEEDEASDLEAGRGGGSGKKKKVWETHTIGKIIHDEDTESSTGCV